MSLIRSLILGGALAGAAHAAPVSIDISGVQAGGGPLYVSLQTEEQFMKDGGVAGQVIEAPEAGDLSLTFDVPPGRYALSVWHDIDADGDFSMTDAGMPLDGWAMINAAALMGPPRFDQVSVDVGEDGAAIAEAMIYAR